MNRHQFKTILLNMMLVFGSLLFCFISIEIGYRLLDPFPYFSSFEINHTEYGNLSTYDEVLGWKGVSFGEAELVTRNNKIWLSHNRYGFRDIEHNENSSTKPAIVFLGDSFTWGYEVEFEEMFVNLLRDKLPEYEIFNLSHRGYGTDQSLLTFDWWHNTQPIKLVVLMFCKNDVVDNNNRYRYGKPKPKFKLVEGELVLTGVPVPKHKEWIKTQDKAVETVSLKTNIKNICLKSHFLHDVVFRLQMYRNDKKKGNKVKKKKLEQESEHWTAQELELTSRIMGELKKKVESRGARLVVSFIPSKMMLRKYGTLSNDQEIVKLCQQLDIECLNLMPKLRNVWYRTYYKLGSHWNARGHKLVAKVLYNDLLKNNLIP